VCGRYTSTSSPARLAETFHVDELRVVELPIRWNVAPTQPVYAVAESVGPAGPLGSPGPARHRLLGAFRWGLVPPWARDPSVGGRMINARAEGIDRRGAFKEALARRRCLVPADAFYEWKATASPRPGKQPYAFARVDTEPMAFAGVWESWRDRARPEDPPLRTCAIITTAANEVVAPVHHRMPVILAPGDWDEWLDPGAHDVARAKALLVPSPGAELRSWPVSHLVNHAAHEGAELLEPVEQPEPGDRAGSGQGDRLPGLEDGAVAEGV
jgi:putative SOS response-associated peptidase YedK